MDLEPPNFLIESELIIRTIIFFILLCCSALISGAEVALFSLSQTDLNNEEERDNNTSRLIVNILKNPKKLLATILIANNLVNISIVLIFAPIGEFLFSGLSSWLRAICDVGLVTFFILLCGEILPKIYANRNNIFFTRKVIKIIKFLDVILSPLSIPMKKLTESINKFLGKQKSNISVDQLSQALELTSEEDTTKEEHKILSGIVSFGNTETRTVMRPRVDISAISDDMSFVEILDFIKENGYSRVPVYHKNIDNITGVIYAKDLIPYLSKTDFNWKNIKRKAFFVPENKKLDDLLSEFQSKKIHLAIVVDEYGGTSGVITLEDIIEEIVGEISDEFDSEDSFYTKINDNTFIFEGKTSLKDFYRILNISDYIENKFEESRGDAETIAGFLLEIIGNFPEKNQVISFENFTFNIENIDKKRIKQIKVTIYNV